MASAGGRLPLRRPLLLAAAAAPRAAAMGRGLCTPQRRQAYYILDELFINGELQESSKKEVLSVCGHMDEMMDDGGKDDVSAAKAGGKR